MAGRNLFLILFAALLLGACADIVPLTGGDEDDIAPKPVDQYPEQGSVNFSGNSVEMTFDEYVKLNDPANTVTMNPTVGKLATEQKNRTVTVSWEQPLAPNTTYILQLNGAVRDVNENNDSIMQIVFATGMMIDSLALEGRVVNAYSNQAVPQVSVGLYAPGSDPFRLKPVYATRTGSKGEFTFSYLKNAQYDVFAFSDKNKDQLPQADEAIGYVNGAVSVTDTLPVNIALFAPKPVRNKLKAEHVPPGLLIVYNRDSIVPERMTLNGSKVYMNDVNVLSPDSVLVTLPETGIERFRIVYDGDTVTKDIPLADRTGRMLIKPYDQNGKWRQGDTLVFRTNEFVANYSEENIRVISDKGTAIGRSVVISNMNEWIIVPDKTNDRPFTIHYGAAAIIGPPVSAQGKQFERFSDTASFSYTTLLSADLSNLKLNCPDLKGRWIIELVQGEKTIYSLVKPEGADAVEFRRIEPGQYGVRCIHDTNGNGKWDPGSFAAKTQAEEVLRYTLTQKLRANWDVEETLQKKP